MRPVSHADEPVVGLAGEVVTRIRGGHLPGEVRVGVRGGTEVFIAYADEELPRGSRVLVIADRGARAVDVVAHPAG